MIHRLFSSLTSFKELEFGPGLNVVLAKKEVGASDKQTRNRAGKTSLVEIIHFLTGSDAGKESLLRSEAISRETFGLDFDLAGERLVVRRSGSQKSKVTVHGASIPKGKGNLSNTDWMDVLGERMFGLPDVPDANGRTPTFRSLFSYFVRRQLSGAFASPEKAGATMQQAGDYQVALMFLLGLDWRIASDWQAVRDREKTLVELRKAAATGAFGSVIGTAADLRTQLAVAGARLETLQSQIAAFRVLPQYGELESEANELTRVIGGFSNANVVDAATIRDLERAGEVEAAPPVADLASIYAEGRRSPSGRSRKEIRRRAEFSRICCSQST